MSDTDANLVQRVKSGDRLAYGELVARHQKRAYVTALGMVGDHMEAEEVVQEAFLKAYRSLQRFQMRSSFSTWIHRIVINLSIDRLRRRRMTVQGLASEAAHVVGEIPRMSMTTRVQEGPDECVERKELRQVLRDAIDRLSPEHRAVVVLHDIQGLRYAEVADVLGCSIGTVKSRLFYARERLRQVLRGYLATDQ